MMFFKKETAAEAIKGAVSKANVDTVLVVATKDNIGSVALKGNYEHIINGLRAAVIEMMKRFEGLHFEDVIEDMQVSKAENYAKPEKLSDIRSMRVTFRMKDGRMIGKELTPVQAQVLVAAFGMRTGTDGRFEYMSDSSMRRLLGEED